MGTYPHFNPTKYNVQAKIAVVRSGSHSKHNINYHIVWIPKLKEELLRIAKKIEKRCPIEQNTRKTMG